MGFSRLLALKNKYPAATSTVFSIFAPLVAGYIVTVGMIFFVTQYVPKLLAPELQKKVSLDTIIGGYAVMQMMRKPVNWRAENILDAENYPKVARKLFWIGSCFVAVVGWQAS